MEPLGLTWVKLGLNDVLYDPRTKQIYTPNTGKTSVMDENAVMDDPLETRARQWTKGAKGLFTGSTGGVSGGSGGSGKKDLTGGGGSGNLQSSQRIIGVNGGMLKAEDMPKIRLDDGTYAFADAGTKVNRIHSFAGKGTKSALRVEDAFVKKIGGKKGQWQHTTGDVVITVKGVKKTAEVHWFQEPSVGIIKPAVKRWRK